MSRNFRDEICAECKGEKFARQCRHSRDWRDHKVATYDDLAEPDFDCPHGLQINALGIVDAAADVARPPPAGPDSRDGKPRPHCVYCERFMEGCCHSWKVKCARDGLIHRAEECKECEHRLPLEELHIAAIITAWNEGDEVAATVRSLVDSVEHAQLTVIVVDDGSTDGSCNADSLALAACVVRNETPIGIGNSRNFGWQEARLQHADAVSFHDAHMRFPAPSEMPGRGGALEQLAVKALREDAITSAASHDTPSKGKQRGCWLHWDPVFGLQPKWSTPAQVKDALGIPRKGELPAWWRTPCMMGACYVMGADTAGRLAGPDNSLWEDTAGRYGFSEQAMAVKAWLLDVPILQSRDLRAGHKYRGSNPCPNSGTEMWRNVTLCTAALFGQDLFEDRFRAFCQCYLPPEVVDRLAQEGFYLHARHSETFVRRPEAAFVELFGRGALLDEPHATHQWLPKVEEAANHLRALYPDGKGVRILQWRPGESTVLLRGMLPEAQIVCIELDGHRTQTWVRWCKQHGVALHAVRPGGDYSRRPIGQPWSREGFDLVLVGGEDQDLCEHVAERLLRDDGTILINPHADRGVIADEHVKAEREALRKVEAERQGATAQNGGGRPLVTVCLLNWRRPENLGRIFACLEAQTVPLRVVVWDNGWTPSQRLAIEGPDGAPLPVQEHPLVDLYVGAGHNVGCCPRWFLASLAQTEFVCSMDDDLVFADERVLEDAIAAQREQCPDGIVGFFGWSRVEGKSYRRGRHHNGTTTGTWADLIKGRFMLFRRGLLERVPGHLSCLEDLPGSHGLAGHHQEDDVILSLCISRGEPDYHRIPPVLKHRWNDLPQRGVSACAQGGHWQRRDETIRRLLDHFGQLEEGA